jgi:putative addiction module component (TIGR02574 family)
MSEVAEKLFQELQGLSPEERAAITSLLWESFPGIKEELFTYYDEELFADIRNHVLAARPDNSNSLTQQGQILADSVLALAHNERLDLTHWLWQQLPEMGAVLGHDDPELVAEIERRIADMESGKEVGIPAEEVVKQLKEKYG